VEYDTPRQVAAVLMRHAPRRFSSVLEPSVGNGALIAPLRDRIVSNSAAVTAVDIDGSRLSEVPARLGGAAVDLIHADFLEWSENFHIPKFELIVANPPFVAKRNASVPIVAAREIGTGGEWERRVPTEAAFLLRCLRLLNCGGRLLSVLPSSIISSDRATWLRKCIQEVGNIRYVHELPRGSFPTLESRTYLFVFDKSVDHRCVRLQNHDLSRPANLLLPRREAAQGARLDFGFRQASQALDAFRHLTQLKWQNLGEVLEVIRGEIESPITNIDVVHTNSASPCFWKSTVGGGSSSREAGPRSIKNGDLLLSRVGRNCSLTIGASWKMEGRECSDCVVLLRPKRKSDSCKILFALRVMLHCDVIRTLLERGTGACYITADALQSFRIPCGIHKAFPKEYLVYRRSAAACDREKMLEVEAAVLRKMMTAVDVPS
jgi:hypothetical protein